MDGGEDDVVVGLEFDGGEVEYCTRLVGGIENCRILLFERLVVGIVVE